LVAGSRVVLLTLDDIDNWPTPDEGAFTEKIRNQYLNRKNATKSYLNGFSDDTLSDLAPV
jgi:hypothetical protein